MDFKKALQVRRWRPSKAPPPLAADLWSGWICSDGRDSCVTKQAAAADKSTATCSSPKFGPGGVDESSHFFQSHSEEEEKGEVPRDKHE